MLGLKMCATTLITGRLLSVHFFLRTSHMSVPFLSFFQLFTPFSFLLLLIPPSHVHSLLASLHSETQKIPWVALLVLPGAI